MTLEQDLEHGAKAEALLKNEMLMGAAESVRQAYLQKIEQASVRNVDEILHWKGRLACLTHVMKDLEQAVRNGKLAAAELSMKREGLKERFFR